ncbi:dipeptidase PepE [Maribacter sp. HTCC2170]|uniref:dipeptidase PepE n=1 Tax=Maribacter sp. (strain HTCC2170 / KCCM 42371) TaxID=313603 RepID=UPI00006B1ACC|nr:dipeptidase PepE [Maribacter sp. HTCC2170]EAR00848.1 peptidase E [Maribacter sp. HTCC2170]
MTNCILASTSTLHGGTYLNYLFESLNELFENADEILFIPYARPTGITYDDYTKIAQKGFKNINKTIVGIHTFDDPVKAIKNAKGIFIGGGNSFVLVNSLYENNILPSLKEAITNGVPYLGTSAGSNIAGPNIMTTNDMPIVYPPSYDTLGIIPFTINAHYLDPEPTSTHKGETRETRIKEFHVFNDLPVVGLREGSWIRLQNQGIILKGNDYSARIFEKNKEAYELPTESSLGFLR